MFLLPDFIKLQIGNRYPILVLFFKLINFIVTMIGVPCFAETLCFKCDPILNLSILFC